MTKNKIEMAGIQETYQGENKQIKRDKYTWYYSGNKQENCRHGVAFVIRNELINYIQDIIPINEKLMVIKLKGTMPITIIVCYAPTANTETNEKDKFYKTLQNEMRKAKNRGFVTCIGDFNARIQAKLNIEETSLGPHIFDPTLNRLETQSIEILENRSNMIGFAERENAVIINTHFRKPEHKLITYKENKSHPGGPPYNRTNYETLDYMA